MSTNTYSYGLDFFSDALLEEAVNDLLHKALQARTKAESKLKEWRHSSTIFDPFVALLEISASHHTAKQWREGEIMRLVDKDITMAVGAFQQRMLGELPGWESTGEQGGRFDLIHRDPFGYRNRPAIAEVKNRYNTLNKAGMEKTYDDLQKALEWPGYKGYDAYLIQVIQKVNTPDQPWKIPQRGIRDAIRIIGAREIYALSTGDPDAFQKFYHAVEAIVTSHIPYNDSESHSALEAIFDIAYPLRS